MHFVNIPYPRGFDATLAALFCVRCEMTIRFIHLDVIVGCIVWSTIQTLISKCCLDLFNVSSAKNIFNS